LHKRERWHRGLHVKLREASTAANLISERHPLDLEFDEAEAHVLAMRADLMATLREHIKERGWTQSKAAAELGITQPRVSALVKGVWRNFSADMLLLLAARVGLRPRVVVCIDPPN
jgi:predicted XRE-type DNA-binding protein